MDTFHIRGGKPLSGTVRVSGAKNAVLPIMASSLLAEGPVEIGNAPRLRDIDTFGELLGWMGASVERGEDGKGILRIDTRGVRKPEAPYEMVKTMRASVLVLGPLLARHGRARISL
ncbi:MAG: UDP-N-acetylglucosamine 1-carboxyvinyltransferase, partial [Candidatus Deferrimicrobiaceae bacterium]